MATTNLGWQNKFNTTLTSGITAADTNIPLNALPTPTEGYLVIEPDSSTAWEEIYYTSKSGSAVICPSVGAGRGVGGSTAASHSGGATVRMDSTAEMFKALQDGTAISSGAISTPKVSDPYKFSAYRNGALSITNDAVVVFETEEYDTSNNYDTTNGRFTAPVAGFYHFEANLSVLPDATTHFWACSLAKNGSKYKRGPQTRPATTDSLGLNASWTISLSANDYVQVIMEANATGSTGFNVGTAPQFTYWSGFMVSST